MLKLKRLTDQPVLRPRVENRWESRAVFNAAVVYENGMFSLFYRAADQPFKLTGEKPDPAHKFESVIGYATSTDGLNFERRDQPVYKGETAQEAWGVEDPRITKLDDTYYMLYTGFGGRSWDDIRISMATSKDLLTWERRGIVLDEPNKDAALFPERINGRYVLLHRRLPHIWLAFSDDLVHWDQHQIILETRPYSWEEKKIGIAGPPIKMEEGWLLVYHGVDHQHVYRLGFAVLDLQDPTKVLYRQREPILEPELVWEKEGLVPNVVFSCGAAELEDEIYVYYGAADTVIGVASMNKRELKRKLANV
ncbi:MAG: glycosidase [Firmicutes bacterium]|nr:glycosidase [Bacillota bacterium]